MATHPSQVTLRDATVDDLPTLCHLNNAADPAVNALPPPDMRWLYDHAIYRRVAVSSSGEVGAFLLGLGPGIAYDSLNYRWFSARYPTFVYVDRIVVDAALRGQGVGTLLYNDIWQLAQAQKNVLLCEVNLRPRNDISLAFP